jgi:hypothetical protein
MWGEEMAAGAWRWGRRVSGSWTRPEAETGGVVGPWARVRDILGACGPGESGSDPSCGRALSTRWGIRRETEEAVLVRDHRCHAVQQVNHETRYTCKANAEKTVNSFHEFGGTTG